MSSECIEGASGRVYSGQRLPAWSDVCRN